MPLQGIRRVIEGYSGVFGWIWRYSAHSEHLTMWQLTGMLHVESAQVPRGIILIGLIKNCEGFLARGVCPRAGRGVLQRDVF